MNTTFYKLLFFQTISRFSSAVLRFVLLLYLLRQTDSAALYGSVTALAAVPMLLGVLFGGVLADRCRKQHLLAVLDLIVAIGMLAAAAFAGTLPVLPFVLPALCILYAADGRASPTVQACLPVLLHGPALAQGNAGQQFASTFSEMLGTLLGGILFDSLGLRGLLLFGAVLFITAAFGEYTLTIPYCPAPRSPSTDIKQRTLLLNRTLLPLAAILALFNLAVVPAFTVGVPILIVQTLALPDNALAFAQSAMSAGGLLGSILAAALAKRLTLRHGAAPLWCITVFCILLGLAAQPQLPVNAAYIGITVLAFAMMAAAAVFQVMLSAALQTCVSADRIGRTMGAVLLAACLTQPAGQATFGLAYEKAAAFPVAVPLAAAAASAFISIAASCIFKNHIHFTNS